MRELREVCERLSVTKGKTKASIENALVDKINTDKIFNDDFAKSHGKVRTKSKPAQPIIDDGMVVDAAAKPEDVANDDSAGDKAGATNQDGGNAVEDGMHGAENGEGAEKYKLTDPFPCPIFNNFIPTPWNTLFSVGNSLWN